MLKQFLKRWLKSHNRHLCYSSYEITGCHFPDDLRLVVGKADPVIFDVGAHFGESVTEFRKLFASPVIHSFEPDLEAYAKLAMFGEMADVTVKNVALSGEAGVRDIIIYEDSCLNSFHKASEHGPMKNEAMKRVTPVKTSTIDLEMESAGLAELDLLKIDTQGHELDVLRGAGHALENGRVKSLLVEVNISQMYEGQCSFTQVLDCLTVHGYSIVDFYQKARIGHRLSWCNALMIHQSSNQTQS